MDTKKVKLSKKHLQIKFRKKNIKNNCPVSNITYYGYCPNSECPYHLTRITNGEKTGCISNGKQLTFDYIQTVLNIPKKDVKSQYQIALKKMEKAINLFDKFNEYSEKPVRCCTKCGVPIERGNVCLNGVRCEKRRIIAEKALQTASLKIPELEATKSKVWRLIMENNVDVLIKDYNVFVSRHSWDLLPNAIIGEDDASS